MLLSKNNEKGIMECYWFTSQGFLQSWRRVYVQTSWQTVSNITMLHFMFDSLKERLLRLKKGCLHGSMYTIWKNNVATPFKSYDLISPCVFFCLSFDHIQEKNPPHLKTLSAVGPSGLHLRFLLFFFVQDSFIYP